MLRETKGTREKRNMFILSQWCDTESGKPGKTPCFFVHYIGTHRVIRFKKLIKKEKEK